MVIVHFVETHNGIMEVMPECFFLGDITIVNNDCGLADSVDSRLGLDIDVTQRRFYPRVSQVDSLCIMCRKDQIAQIIFAIRQSEHDLAVGRVGGNDFSFLSN